jgi:probable phosphoglycerate mutase
VVQLVLVRHALPERTRSETGGVDPVLTAAGHRQAAALAGYLRNEPVQAVVASPMARARQTAAPLAAALGLTVEIDDGLVEYDSGHSSYVPVHEMREADPVLWQQLMRGELPAGVDAAAFRARVVAALDRIAARYPGRQSVAVICHAGVINAALAAFLAIERGLPFAVDYCGVSRVLAMRDGRRAILCVNETAHVRALLPTVG